MSEAGQRGLTRRKAIQLLGAGVAAAAVPEVLRIAAYAAPAQTLRIGFLSPLTGPYAEEASDQVRGATLAIEEHNRAGGVLGRQVELLVRDDQLRPAEGSRRTVELIEREHVNFIAGSLSAAVQLAVNEVTKRAKMLFVSVSQSDKIVMPPDFSPWTFHEALTPWMTSTALAQSVLRDGRGKRVFLLISDYAYGHEQAAAWRRVIRAVGAEEAGADLHPLGTTDYSSFFPKIAASRADVLVLANFGGDTLNSLKQAIEFGIKRRMRIAVPIIPLTVALGAGADAIADVVCASSYYWEVQQHNAAARAFNTQFSRRFNRVPSDYAGYAYSGVSEILDAVGRVNSPDAAAVANGMEGHRYAHYKEAQVWRRCDHQSVQSIYLLRGRPKTTGAYGFFEIIGTVDGAGVIPSCETLGHKS